MKSVNFHFKGLMVPVFTPFTADKKQVNYDIVDKYACYLKQKGIKGVLVNGTVGEGTTLRTEERKRITEEWWKVCRKYDLVLMVQIGGTSVADVYELAEHAEKLGVSAILVLPDLFFRPACEEDLVEYLKEVSKYAPTRPLYYFHIPKYTHVKLDLPRFLELAEQHISTFCGIDYVNGDLTEAVTLLKQGRNIFIGHDTILVAALALGFDAAILTTLNIVPEFVITIYESILNNKLREAQEAQIKLNHRIGEITNYGKLDWVESMKTEFNKVNTVFQAGPWRKPTFFKRN
jgi:N-acetylneuraminate lyase